MCEEHNEKYRCARSTMGNADVRGAQWAMQVCEEHNGQRRCARSTMGNADVRGAQWAKQMCEEHKLSSDLAQESTRR